MKYSEYRFTLDLQKHQSQTTIAVFQGDTAVRLYISLTDGGKPYTLADKSFATFYGKRPDGKPLVHSCTVVNTAEIMYEFQPSTTYALGIVNCQCRIYSIDQELITAPRFSINVEEKVVGDDDFLPSDEELSIIDKIVEEENQRKQAEFLRGNNEASRIFNENIRQLHEFGGTDENGETIIGRVNAENERVRNELQRQSNELERQSNENERNSSVKETLDLISKTGGTIDTKVKSEIGTHNESDDAHSDIRDAITNLTKTDGEIDTQISAKLSVHNESVDAHFDIRKDITDITKKDGTIDTKISSEISTHNKSTEAHSDIRKDITDITKKDGTIDTKVKSEIGTHNESDDAHSDIRKDIADLENTLNTFLESDNTSIEEMKKILESIKKDKDFISELTKESLKAEDVVDNLTSTATDKPLSANQGKVLQENKLDISRPNSSNEWSYSKIPVFSNVYGANNPVYLIDVTPTSAVGYSIPRRDTKGNLVAPNTQQVPEYNADGTLKQDYYAGAGYVLAQIEALKKELTFEPIKITNFETNVDSDFEWGSSVSDIELSWEATKSPSKLTITDSSETTADKTNTFTEGATSGSIDILGSFTGSRKWKIEVTDPENNNVTDTAEVSISGKYRVFYGVSGSANITAADMKTLGNSLLTKTRKRTFEVDTGSKLELDENNNPTAKYAYYCVPKESPYSLDVFGTCSFSYRGGIGGFDPAYEVTYKNGSTETVYLVYRSTNCGFGTMEFTVE